MKERIVKMFRDSTFVVNELSCGRPQSRSKINGQMAKFAGK